MKIYIHEGKGHYIGSTVVTICENLEIAKKLIRATLDDMGLSQEELSISETKISPNNVIYQASGDY